MGEYQPGRKTETGRSLAVGKPIVALTQRVETLQAERTR
jgi:hypothetical protein